MLGLVRAFLRSFTGIPRPVKLLALAMFVNRCGGLVAPFLAVYLRDVLDVSTRDVGIVLAAHGVGGVVGAWLGGVLVGRFGPKPILVASLTATSGLLLALKTVSSPLYIGAILAVLGVALLMFWPAQLYALIESSEGNPRRALALNRVAIGAAWLVAPIAGGVLLAHDPEWLFHVDAATCLAGALLVLNLRLPSMARHGASRGIAAMKPKPWLVIGIAGLVALAYFQLDGPLQVYWREVTQLTELDIGMLLAMNGVIIVVAQIPISRLASEFPPLPAAALGVVLIGAGLGILPLLPPSGGACIVGFALFTVGEMLWFPSIGGFVGEDVTPSMRARTLGAIETAYSIGRIGAPMMAMFLFDAVSPNAAWYALTAVCAIAAVGLMVRHSRSTLPQAGAGALTSRPSVSDVMWNTSSLVTDVLATRHRVFFDNAVDVLVGDRTVAAKARDLGPSGIGLRMEGEGLSKGDEVQVAFIVGDDPLTVGGVVRWCAPDGDGAILGIEFAAGDRLPSMRIAEYVWAVLDQQFEDRGSEARKRYEARVTVRAGDRTLRLLAQDLSLHGMSIQGEAELVVGEAVTVSLMGGDGAPFELPARIAWSRQETMTLFRCGLAFDTDRVSPDSARGLDSLLRGHPPKPRGAARAPTVSPP